MYGTHSAQAKFCQLFIGCHQGEPAHKPQRHQPLLDRHQRGHPRHQDGRGLGRGLRVFSSLRRGLRGLEVVLRDGVGLLELDQAAVGLEHDGAVEAG